MMSKTLVIITLIVLAVAGLGSFFTMNGMSWYQTLILPSWILPSYVFGLVWTIIFILTGMAAYNIWTRYQPRDIRFWLIVTLLVSNAILNVLWSFLFFTEHMLGAATIGAAALLAVTVFTSFLAWGPARRASVLLLPYAAWVTFATYLSYIVWSLN
jgi:tryptophan-rich sensory protein